MHPLWILWFYNDTLLRVVTTALILQPTLFPPFHPPGVFGQHHERKVMNIPKRCTNFTKAAFVETHFIFVWFQQSVNLASQPVLFLIDPAGAAQLVWPNGLKWKMDTSVHKWVHFYKIYELRWSWWSLWWWCGKWGTMQTEFNAEKGSFRTTKYQL